MNNQKGYIIPVLIIIALIILGVVAYFLSPKSISSINVKMPVTPPVATVSKSPQIVLTTKPTLDPKLNRITLSNSIGRYG